MRSEMATFDKIVSAADYAVFVQTLLK